MTTEILGDPIIEKIDWSRYQWLISSAGEIVLTNGEHQNGDFSGTCLPHEFFPNGEFRKDWVKSAFQLIPKDGLVIKIKNK
jgi:hypothetical protein